MYRDFHYYGTYVAARLAGYNKAEAETIAYAAQYVDDSNQNRLLKEGDYGLDFQPIPTVQTNGQVINSNIYEKRNVWVPFHFLPGNLSGIVKYKGDTSKGTLIKWNYDDKAKREFQLMSLPNSDLARDIINDIVDNHLEDPHLLELIGLRMHVLADTSAHESFAGVPAWHINGRSKKVIDKITYLKYVPYGLMPNSEYCTPDTTIYNDSMFYLGHGRLGSIPDYPWLKFEYNPTWANRSMEDPLYILRDNPQSYFISFLHVYTALNCFKNRKHFDFNNLDHPKSEYLTAIQNIINTPHWYGSSWLGDDRHMMERCQNWINAIDQKIFGDIGLPKLYNEDSWLNEIIKSEKHYPPNPISETHYYKFSKAAILHLDFVNFQLNKFGIDLNTEDLSYSLGPSPYKPLDIVKSFPTRGSIKSSPAIFDDVAYFGGDSGIVSAFDLKKLTEIWSYTTGGNVKSSPMVAMGLVFVGCSDGNVYALNVADGSLAWKFPTKGPVVSSPNIKGEILYIGSDDHNIYALELKTGRLVWVYTTGGCVRSKPELAQGLVFIGSMDRFVYAINDINGEEMWKRPVMREIQGSLTYTDVAIHDKDGKVICNGLVIMGEGEIIDGYPRACIQAFDVSKGNAYDWSIAFLDDELDAFYSKPAVYEDNVILRSMCRLEVYKKYDGAKVKTIYETDTQLPFDIQPSPVIADGLIYAVQSRAPTFNIYDVATFRLLYSYNIGISQSTPAVSDGVIVVGSNDSKLYVLGNSRAKFVASPIYGNPPLTVKFTDKTLFAPNSWDWKFAKKGSDKPISDNVQNPVFEFKESGIYTVALTAEGDNWDATTVKENTIYVLEPSNIKMSGDIAQLSSLPNRMDYKFIGGSSAVWLNEEGEIIVDTFLGKKIDLKYRSCGQLTNMAAIGNRFPQPHYNFLDHWKISDNKVDSNVDDDMDRYIATKGEFVAISSWGDWILSIQKDIWGNTYLCVDGSIEARWACPEVFDNVPKESGWRKISAGYDHAMALRNDGELVIWGNNDYGQLNLGGSSPTGNKFLDIAAGYRFSLGLYKNSHIITGAGKDDFGQISRIPQGKNIVSLAAGLNTAAGLTGDGRIITWGAPLTGLPAPEDTDTGYTQISLGTIANYLLAIKGTQK